MPAVTTLQWDGTKSMGAGPRRVFLNGDAFVEQGDGVTVSTRVRGLHNAHFVFCRPSRSKLRGVLKLGAKASHLKVFPATKTLHFVADVSPDSTSDEQQRLLRMALESLQTDIVRWSLLLFGRTQRLSYSLVDVESAFPLLRSLPFQSRVATVEAATVRYGCGILLWRDNNLVFVNVAKPLLALRPSPPIRQRCARAMALAAATVQSLCDIPLPELVQHVASLNRRVQRYFMDDPCHNIALSSVVGVALLVALQTVAPFYEFPNMCPSVRACLSGTLYALYASSGFQTLSDTRQLLGHIIRKKTLKPGEWVPLFELTVAGALAPRPAVSRDTTDLCVGGAGVAYDDSGASTFFSSQYHHDSALSCTVDALPLGSDLQPDDTNRVGIALSMRTLSLTVLLNDTLADAASATPCKAPHVNVGTLGYLSVLPPFGAAAGAREWLQLTVESTTLKRSAAE